jgi:hypothetical protein
MRPIVRIVSHIVRKSHPKTQVSVFETRLPRPARANEMATRLPLTFYLSDPILWVEVLLVYGT